MAKGQPSSKKADTAKTYGRYRVLSPLGQGAMASVFLAEDPSLGRLVAIKVIHLHLAAQADLLTRFTSEAKTAASLRSPNIVEVFDYGMESGAQYLVMEYIDGPTLQHVLNQQMGSPLPMTLAASLAVQAAEGLLVAERKSVVHRDIKPENLMLTSSGLLKIADFGIAHINEQNLTRTGSILGSPSYMAPEQIDGGKPSHQTDMFALGAVFYSCLTGRKPFNGPNIPSIFRAICELPHVPARESNPDCHELLATMVDTLLSKAPEDRGAGAKALSGQLRQWLNQQGVYDPAEEVSRFLGTLQPEGDKTMMESAQANSVLESEPEPEPIKPGAKREIKAAAKAAAKQASQAQAAEKKSNEAKAETNPSALKSLRLPKWALFSMAGSMGVLFLVVMLVVANSGGKKKSEVKAPLPQSNVAETVLPQAKESTPPVPVPTAPEIKLVPSSLEMKVGETSSPVLQGLPNDSSATLTWTSSAPNVAVWQDRQILAKAPGQAMLRALWQSQGLSAEASASVIVLAEPPTPPAASLPATLPSQPSQALPPSGTAGQAIAGSTATAAKTDTAAQASGPCLLSVTSAPPFAEVFLDGRFIGATPLKGKTVSTGRHKLLISHRRFASIDTTLRVVSGPLSLKFRFTKEKQP